jgi:broad specificity phosphatase PhoE
MRSARLVPAACLLLLACVGARPGDGRREEPPPSASTLVLLVRHAEKGSEREDPSLTPAGRQRAEALVEVAGRAGVSAVYTTQLRRTRETAGPLVERLGLPVTVKELPRGQPQAHATELARELLARHRGETVLVVGHSHTLPLLVEALAGVPIEPLPESEYDRLYVVRVPPSGPAGLIQARYGAPGAAP